MVRANEHCRNLFLTFLFVVEDNKKKGVAKELSEAKKLRRLRWFLT